MLNKDLSIPECKAEHLSYLFCLTGANEHCWLHGRSFGVEDHRPEWQSSADRPTGRDLRARLQRDARLLGRRGTHSRSTVQYTRLVAFSKSNQMDHVFMCSCVFLQVIGADRFYRTGDLGIMDANGNLRVVGRLKDLIVRGGSKVFPAEVEQVH